MTASDSVRALPGRTKRDLAREGERVKPPMARRLTLTRLVGAVWCDARRHHLQVFAGDLAYNAFLGMIPFVLFIGLVLRGLHADALLIGSIGVFSSTLPASSAGWLEDQVQSEVASRMPDWWLLGVLLAAGSLWACSAAFRALGTALNVVYDVTERRPPVVSVVLSLVLALAVAVAWLLEWMLTQVLSSALVPILLLGGFVLSAMVYGAVPCDRRPFRAIAPGALCAALMWCAFTFGFDFVLNEFGAFLLDPLYGWFTGLFALLIYVYWTAYILLLGAELNHVIEVSGRVSSHS
jgi:membrane protein